MIASSIIHLSFSTLKIAFDILNIAAAALLSLVLFDFALVGLREGTILSAVLTGVSVKACLKLLGKRLDPWLEGKRGPRPEASLQDDVT